MPNYFQIPPCITKLWVGHEQVSLKSMHKIEVRTVILTFDLATWFLFMTHCLVMMIICAKLFSNPMMHNKVMGWTGTGFTDVYAQSLSADVTLTFDLALRILFATHCLVMIICAKLFSNPTTHNKVMGRTRTGFTGLCIKFKWEL